MVVVVAGRWLHGDGLDSDMFEHEMVFSDDDLVDEDRKGVEAGDAEEKGVEGAQAASVAHSDSGLVRGTACFVACCTPVPTHPTPFVCSHHTLGLTRTRCARFQVVADNMDEDVGAAPADEEDPDRLGTMMQLIDSRLDRADTIMYRDLAPTNRTSRRLAAECFFKLLKLKSMDVVDVQQEGPYGDIAISKTVRHSNARL